MGNNHSHTKFLHIAIVASLFLWPVIGRGGGVVNSASESALNSALAGGGTVTFGFDGAITVTSPKTISTNTVIDGGGHTVILSGGGSSQLFLVSTNASLTLANLTIANGHTTTNGGAIYNRGMLSAFNCVFTNNAAVGTNGPNGADGNNNGLYGSGGKAGGDGGWVNGGAIYTVGSLTLFNCDFETNGAFGGSGGSGGNGGIGSCGSSGGGAGGDGGSAYGGAIYSTNALSITNFVSITNCTFHGNQSIGGLGGQGGVYGQTGGPCGAQGPSASGGLGGDVSGGAIFVQQNSAIVGSTFYQNFGIGANAGNAGAQTSGIGPNGRGGGDSFGGGLFNSGTNSLVNCTFYDNIVFGGTGGNGSSGFGTGGNGGDTGGGGLYIVANTGITNCTFSTNGAYGGTGGSGGGGNGGNGTSAGGNIKRAGGTCTWKNSIIAYASHGGNGSGTITDAGYNISDDTSISMGGTGSQRNVDPKLSVLAYNGGPTPTCALQSTSPAIDKADTTTAPLQDQRGLYRTYAADVGAFEYNAASGQYTFVSVEASDDFAFRAATNDTAMFTITRTGKITETNTFALDISGTAISGTDYAALLTNIVMVPGVVSTNLIVTPLGAPSNAPTETVVLGLKPSTNYFLGLDTNAVVVIGQDAAGIRSTYPGGARYLRGAGTNLDNYLIIVPLDGLTGTQHSNIDVTFPYPSVYLYNGAIGGTQTTTNNRIACNSPIASFGQTWGTPTYTGQSYSVGVHFFSTGFYDPIEIQVYYRSNHAYVGQINLNVPDTSDWQAFATNGFVTTATNYGLTTTLRQAPDLTLGTTSQAYVLTHTASDAATNYIFLTTAGGQFGGQNVFLTGTGTASYGALYETVFDTRPPTLSAFIHQPHFAGQPLPPDLLNKTPQELFNYGAMVTNSVALTPSACTNLDQSPELRRHPILDQFVSDLNNDPIALANYVQNEIDLTDPVGFRDDGHIDSESVNLGGVNRGAVGVYLEGQGSPIEQCSLLVYLLRQAGYPATYVFPPDGGLKLLDTRLSQLLRMQIVGAQDSEGHLYTTNHLISVNYPWVAAYINGQWVHLFPWLKDTQVIEGLNLNDYLPDNYKRLQLWAKDYVLGKTNLMAFAKPDDDTPSVIFPAWLSSVLQSNAPGVSVDDIGMQYVNRRHLYSTWGDFPRPTLVTNTSIAVESLSSSGITNVSPLLTNIFNTVSVQLYSLNNPTNSISVGPLRVADLHNRKFFLTSTNIGGGQIQEILTLGPFQPNASGQGNFSPSDTAMTNKQVLALTLNNTDDDLRLRIAYRRQPELSWSTPLELGNGFLQIIETRQLGQERKLRKGDTTAICIDVGRVTPAMLNVHAQELWNMEQQLGTNSGASASSDVYEGSLLYLMGMNYFQQLARFDDQNARLNKVQNFSTFAMGLAKLSPRRDYAGNLYNGAIDPVLPNVDMWFYEAAGAANGTVRADSGWDLDLARQNFEAMRITDGSAREHMILDTFFGQSAAVSTVKLLQMAQAKVASGGPPVVELNYYNYLSAGNTTYNGVALKDADPAMWQQVVNAFSESDFNGLYAIAWLTPGPQTTPSGSFSGMAALILSPQTYTAAIGDNNGAYGDNLGSGTVSSTSAGQYNLTFGDGSYHFDIQNNAPNSDGTLEQAPTFGLVQAAGSYVNNVAIPTPAQSQQAQGQSAYYGAGNMDYPSTMSTSVDLGANDSKTIDKKGNGFWQSVADPVNSLTGEFYVDDVDLSLPGPMPLQMRRNYGSQNLANSMMGYGWKLNYMPFLTVTASNLVYESEPDGSVFALASIGTNLWAPTLALNPTLNNDSINGIGSVANALNARLVEINTNSLTFYYLTNGDGSLRVFQDMSFPLTNSTAWDRLRPYLTTWLDNRGNSYSFEYGTNSTEADYGQVRRIVSSSGNILLFDYDVYGRIVNAFSLDGRSVQYDYDQHGDLVTVTRPDTSQINYEYQLLNWTTNGVTSVYSTHLLLREDKPDGRVLQNAYDDQRRCTNQWSTVGPDLRLVRNASFRYTNNFNLTNITSTLTGSTTILDYTNNPATYFYTNGLVRRILDPLGGQVVQDWYEASETNAPAYPRSLKTATDKRGLVTSYLYDSNGNVTNTTVKGDLLGDGNTNTIAVSVAVFNANNLPTMTVNASGTTNFYFYTNSASGIPGNWLLARRETWPLNATAAQSITNSYDYGNVTNAGDGTVSYGLRQREIRAALSPDASTNELTYSSRGFPIQQVRHTGTGDPDVILTNAYNTRGELVVQTDAAGASTTFGYDPNGKIQSREVFDVGQGVPMSWDFSFYNENGELTWNDGPRFNPEDYVWRDYDGAGRKSQEIHWRSEAKADGSGMQAPAGDALYATTFFEFDPFGNLTKVTDAQGNYSRKYYDTIGQLLREEFYNASGTLLATNGFAYNLAGDVTNQYNALAGATSKRFNSAGLPEFQQNPDGSTGSWLYYADGRVRRQIQNNGAYWETTYNDAARTVTRIFYSSSSVALATNSVQLDRRGNTILTTDAGGNTFTNVYDGLDRLKLSAGPPILSITQGGTISNPTNVIYITNVVQQVANYFYDAVGRVTTNVNALGEKTIVYRDALGRATRTEIRNSSNALVRETSTAYSIDHNSVTVTNGSGSGAIANTAWMDNDGHTALSVAYPASGTLEYTLLRFDLLGNQTYSEHDTSSNGVVSTWTFDSRTYDGLNRLSQTLDRDNAATIYRYNAAGAVTNRVMPGGLQWSASYDSAGRVLQDWITGTDGSTCTRTNSYTYFSAGNSFAGLLQTSTEGRGWAATYSYDDWLRATNVSRGTPDGTLTTTWAFDPRGLATNIIENNTGAGSGTGPVSVSRTYDAYGELSSEAVVVGSTNYSGVGQGWDSAGRRVSLGINGFGYAFGWRADGKLASASTPAGGGFYNYDSAGVLTNRSVDSRLTTITSRDGEGRPLAISTLNNLSTVLNESLTYTGDGLIATHTLARSDFTDSRAYSYANLTRRLVSEQLGLSASTRWTNTFGYDSGLSAGPGALTSAGAPGTGLANWKGGTSIFARVNSETNTTITWPTFGRINGRASVGIALDGRSVPFTTINTSDPSWTNEWFATLELTPGPHQLSASATVPSGFFTTNVTSWFTNNSGAQTATVFRDAAGNVTQKIWLNANGTTNRTQIFFWDAKERLYTIGETDANGNGFLWFADYDGLNRRIRTQWHYTTNGIIYLPPKGYVDVHSQYDPQVEFLELGVTVNGMQSWKLCGPDLNGNYGGMNGTGGLDATVPDSFNFNPVITDARGNVLGEVTNGAVAWFNSRPSAYGTVPSYRPVPMGMGGSLAQSSAWCGRRVEMNGWVNLGARFYDPESGAFLGYDPQWNSRDPNFLTFAGGDPINYFDSDGRFGKGLYQGWNSGTSPAGSSRAFDFAYMIGGVFNGGYEGANGGAQIVDNTLTFGGTDALGWTSANQLQGDSDYNSSRVLATVGRESLITAATLGTFQAARTGSELALYGYQGLQTFNAGRSGWAIGTGIDQVANGDNRGYLNIAGGTLGLAGGFTMTAVAPELNAGVQTMRQGVAQNFYEAAGWPQARIDNHLQGIDFSQPVNTVTLPQGSQVVQYQLPGSPTGNYFAPAGTPANTLGIYTSGLEGTTYTATQPVNALRSTAAPIVDTWSMRGAGWRIQNPGGGTQFFVPQQGTLIPTPPVH